MANQKISTYLTEVLALVNNDRLDVSKEISPGVFDSQYLKYSTLLTELNTDLTDANIYGGDGVIGAGRTATLTDTLTFTGGKTIFGASALGYASINLGNGVDPSGPIDGDLWYNGTNLYFRDGVTSVDLLTGDGSLYAGDGTLAGNRTVSQGSNTLEFNVDNKGASPFNILSLTETGGGSIIHTVGFNSSAKILLNGLLTADISLDTSGSSYINTGFNFGVGTTTPTLKLSVEGTAGIAGLADFSSGTGRVVVIKDYLNHAVMDFSNSTAPTTILGRFYTGGNSWFNTTGNFGFGTTTPTEKLEVVGNAKITGGIDVDSSTFLVDASTGAFSLGDGATGAADKNAVTIGALASTTGSGLSIAVGKSATAIAAGATSNIAIGNEANASGTGANNIISIGDRSGSTINDFDTGQGILIGYLAGNKSTTMGTQTVAIGDQTNASGIQATLLGSQAQAAANWAIAVGWDSRSNFASGIAIGLRAETGATRAYVMGSGVTNPPVNSVADSFGIGFDETIVSGNNIRFRFAKTADSYLNGSGNVGIGTTTPSDKLEVVGNLNATRYKVNGVAGANHSGAVATITVVDGLVTLVT